VFGAFQPVLTPAGVAAYGRDPASSEQVWSSEVGYPGDPDYLEFHRDLAHDVDPAWLRPFLNPDSGRRLTGFRYHRITGRQGEKAPYRPELARQKARLHAAHFVASRETQLAEVAPLIAPREPVVLAPYDAELFGHWWAEGPWFLEEVLRQVACSSQLCSTGPLACLAHCGDLQVLQPAESSWGAQGNASTWVSPSNDWIHRHLHVAALKMVETVAAHPDASGAVARALDQAARELLLAQASDWPFLVQTGGAPEYAARRVREHVANCLSLLEQVRTGSVDGTALSRLEARNNLFPGLDHRVYRPGPT
jgi:1,4-alpha-glucan branching enzyme